MKSANYSVALAFVAIATSFFGCSGFVSPNPIVRKISRTNQPNPTNKVNKKNPVAFFGSTSDSTQGAIEISEPKDDDLEDAAKSLLSFMVFDAIAATKELALNWGFVLQSGITKLIGGSLALILPIVATEVALNVIAYSLAVVSAFNVIVGFKGQGGNFKLQSFLLAAIQAFFSYRIIFYPFRSLRLLTTLVASACIADGAFETIAAVQNSDLPGRWTLLISGLASIVGGTLVAANIATSSLFVLGLLLGSNLLSSGVASIRAAFFGRQIANKYLIEADFEGDAVEVIETVAEAI